MFQEQVFVLDNNTIKITVTIEKRKSAFDERLIYNSDPSRLIPETFRNKVKLRSKPSDIISNQNLLHHSNYGEWVYEIINLETKETTKKQPARKPSRRTRRKQTVNAKNK